MNIEQLKGQEERLYQLVAPLVMDKKVLAQNGNVAFYTSDRHVWFVAVDAERCIGFFPVKIKNEMLEVNNYHVDKRDETVFKALLKAVKVYAKRKKKAIQINMQNIDLPYLSENSYDILKKFVNYTRIEDECL
jgi:hypothetical protein